MTELALPVPKSTSRQVNMNQYHFVGFFLTLAVPQLYLDVMTISAPWLLTPNLQLHPWDSSHLFSRKLCMTSTPSPCSEITHDLSTDGVVPLVWCHSKSPSKPIPSNHVTGRIHSSIAPSLSTAFPPQAGVPIQFLHRSRAKKGQRNQIRGVLKAFP